MYKFFGILFTLVSHSSGSDTRTECLTAIGMGNDNFDLGGDGFGGGVFGGDRFGGDGFGFGGMEGDEFDGTGFGMGEMEGDEFGGGFGEADEEFGRLGALNRFPSVAGKLSCPKGNRGSILVKRIKFGVSAFPGTCQSIPFCQEKFENGEKLAKKCNGGTTCSVKMLPPKFLNCRQPSSYMLVEYECVDTWATFEICESLTTVARGASVIITSPGYLGTSKPGSTGVQMCECIIQSHDKADMYMDYLQTQLASKGDQCPYEYVLVESKRHINQTGIDKEIEVCGNQQVGGRWLQGSVRITYASGGPMKKQGLLARFTADNIGNTPMIQLECGKVSTKGVKLLQRPPQNEPTNNDFMMPYGSNFGLNGGNFGMKMPMPMMPQFPTPTASKPKWTVKIAKEEAPVSQNQKPSLKVSLPAKTFGEQTVYADTARPAGIPGKAPMVKIPPNKKAANRNKGRAQGGPERRLPKKNGAGKVVADGEESVVKEIPAEKNHSGGMVALVFAGIGAVLILGSVGILMMHNYIKRRRIRRKEEVYASGGSASITYGKGWEMDSVSGLSIYATIADVDAHRDGCVNPAVGTSDELEKVKTSSTADTKDKSKVPREMRMADDNSDTLDPYDKINLKSQVKASKLKSEIAVIEVHQSFHSAEEKLESARDEYGLPVCRLTSSRKLPSANGCTDCNISRPPRRKDGARDYDNNFGVKRQQK